MVIVKFAPQNVYFVKSDTNVPLMYPQFLTTLSELTRFLWRVFVKGLVSVFSSCPWAFVCLYDVLFVLFFFLLILNFPNKVYSPWWNYRGFPQMPVYIKGALFVSWSSVFMYCIVYSLLLYFIVFLMLLLFAISLPTPWLWQVNHWLGK